MSSNGEGIIRETFQKLGDIIGVQMQIPDDMIKSLGVALQAQIDLLAELHSAGRLIPAGGMALTAEQVEDVRTVVFTKSGSDTYLLAGETVDRLRALFPATEPAEEETKAEGPVGTVCDETQKAYDEAVSLSYWLAQQLGEHVDDAYDRGETLTDTVQRLIEHIRPNRGKTKTVSVPVVEEETKAELCAVRLCVLPARHSGVHADREGLRWNNPASSPVVPAPTETGPWQTWQEVPDGVQYYGINAWGPTYYVNRGGVRYRVFDDTPSKTADCIVQGFAPFVAAEEG